MDRSEPPMDSEGLAEFLSALSYSTRLDLLQILRFPRTLNEIRLPARRGASRDQTASRPAVISHLEKLESANLVRVEQVLSEGRRVNRYQVNALKLYELTEELRRLSVIHAGRGPVGDATGTLQPEAPAQRERGPRLILVHGLYEGKTFSLDPVSAAGSQWRIGRRKGLPVALDYDPYVSLENSVVRWEAGHYVVTDLSESKNGTSVNWELLPKGGTRLLKAADVIGVGRSLLSFAPA